MLDVLVGIPTSAMISFAAVLKFSLDGVLNMLSLDGVAGILLSGEVTMMSRKIAVEDSGQGGAVGWRRWNSYLCGRSSIAKIMGRTKGVGAKVTCAIV